MPLSPFFAYIQLYFPQDQWGNADCITMHEDGSQDPTRVSPPNDDGTRDHGLFQINDYWWNPDNNPNSPFTRAQWGARYDPNVNTWMASVIFSRNGWYDWATRFLCGVDGIYGPHAIPHPNGPLIDPFVQGGNPVVTPANYPMGGNNAAAIGIALILGGVSLYLLSQKGLSR